MCGNKIVIFVYLGHVRSSKWIYTNLLSLLDTLASKNVFSNNIKFITTKMSGCCDVVTKFANGIGSECEVLESPSATVRFGSVSSEVKEHHLNGMLDTDILVISKSYKYDVYIDSLAKSFKPVVVTLEDDGESMTNEKMIKLKDKVMGVKRET